jgi:Rrf2 family transcriptional regulator, cysteine metabolism repressor
MQLLASEEYGLRCLLRVCRREAGTGAPVAISAIACDEGLSPEYTAKLMRELRLGGLVESVRGADGGYRLARPAEEISVWSALQVLGGAFFSEGFCACHGGQAQRCVRSSDCSLRALWRAVQQALCDALEGVSLADLQRDERAMADWLDPVRLVPVPQSTEPAKLPEESR